MGAALKLEQLQVLESDRGKRRAHLRLLGDPILSVNNGITSYADVRDVNGLILSKFDAHNPETRINDARGRVITRTFQNGRVLTYIWDDFDRITSLSDSAGPSVSNTYDVMGKLRVQTLTPFGGGAPQMTFLEYDDRDRLTKVTNPKGEVTQYGYNIISVGCRVRDLVTSVTDNAGKVQTKSYDSRQRLVRETDAKGQVSRYEYNPRGDMIAMTDGTGSRSTFSFDGNARLVQVTKPVLVAGASGAPTSATQVTNLSYDTGGRLISTDKYALGVNGTHAVTTLAYDALDRLIEKRLSKVDSSGNTISVDDDAIFSYQRQLDATLRASASNSTENLGFTHESAPPFLLSSYSVAAGPSGSSVANQGAYLVARDATGNISGVTGPPGQLYTASYDPAGRLTQVLSNFNASNFSVGLGYDGLSRKSSITHSTGLSGSFGFDILNRPTSITWNGFDGQAAQSMSENIGYDGVGNAVSITRELGSFSLGYDNADQLTSLGFVPNQGVDLGPLVNRSFGYDAAGNRTSDNINGAGVFFANAILSDALHSYQFDSNGFGNLAQKATPSAQVIDLYSYRADNRMVGFTRVADANGNGIYEPGTDQVTISAQYAFDALGRRVLKTIQGTSNFTQSFVYLGDTNTILLGTAGNGSTTLYLDGQHPNEHLAAIGPNGVTAYVTDHLGSVLNTDLAGSAHAFGVYGEILGAAPAITPSTDPASFAHAGVPYDREKEQYSYPPRDRDPAIGFVQQDSYWPRAGLNDRNYAWNSPANYVDPSGHNPLVVLILVGLWVAEEVMTSHGTSDSITPVSSPVDVAAGYAGARIAGLISACPAASQAADFAPGKLASHFEKHGAEFGYSTAEEYLQGARSLVRGGEDVLTSVRTNGDTLFFNQATNEFAVQTQNGVIRTYFRPNDGLNYWFRQTGQ